MEDIKKSLEDLHKKVERLDNLIMLIIKKQEIKIPSHLQPDYPGKGLSTADGPPIKFFK